MFELVVGELDMILGRIDDDFDFEPSVFDAFATADDDRAFARRMDEIGADLAAARDTLPAQQARHGCAGRRRAAVIGQHGPALAFWLSYLDYQGGLWEQSGDTVLAILPGQLSAMHDLPETALITDDPDIAREDGVLFLGSGHPEIDKGAETIIGTGDVGALTLPHRAKQTSTEDLLARIRDQVPVDHGRIDATGSILRSHRSLLRLGALVSHTVSADEQFTEVAECLLDVPSRVAWAPDAADRLLSAIGTSEATAGPEVQASRLARRGGRRPPRTRHAAARRGQELSVEADAERAAEITRATEYYAAALAAIDKRRTGADAQRQALLDARAQATISERDRRLAEISEKYRHQHVLRPYRLHLIDLPVWRLATDVRRGERRWPMTFDYLPSLGTVAPTRCPTCDAHSPLVATKTHLGCGTLCPCPNTAPPPRPGGRETAARTCATERAADRDHSRPGAGAQAAAARQHAGDRPEAARRRRGRPPRPGGTEHVGPGAARRPFLPGKPEERKIVDFWNQVGAGETRKLSRLIAPDSPLAALTRLYGTAGSAARDRCSGRSYSAFVHLRQLRPAGRGSTRWHRRRAAHPSRPVPVPAAVVAGQAP